MRSFKFYFCTSPRWPNKISGGVAETKYRIGTNIKSINLLKSFTNAYKQVYSFSNF